MSKRLTAGVVENKGGRKKSVPVEVDGHRLMLSNLDKVLYPEAGFTKAETIEYYREISPFMLPHLKGRMLTLKRYPEGTGKAFFYEKRCPSYRPSWMKTHKVERKHGGEPIPYCQIDGLAAMVWVVNLASLEFHTLLSRGADTHRPTMMVFDLDPGPGAGLKQCAQAALKFRKLLEQLKLESFCKTSGGKGIHLYVPLNTAVTFEQTKVFSHTLALHLEKMYPDDVTSQMRKDLRPGKIFIDWSQNDERKTTVCVYSLRARERPTVSMPLTWEEVQACSRSKKTDLFRFEARAALKRVKKTGDLFAPVLTKKQKLPPLSPKD